ncbi:hypothetical protein CEXT_150891 [Caerostris extrusa]|uniref:Transposase-associated domain-containing protein n=1 Tax=Caerostris extrusa TaxID=172846 RepID=A0AAV4PHB2_CAEEX|nr:hypothetical protein CEXT_150891 [Caerostris extrusa]
MDTLLVSNYVLGAGGLPDVWSDRQSIYLIFAMKEEQFGVIRFLAAEGVGVYESVCHTILQTVRGGFARDCPCSSCSYIVLKTIPRRVLEDDESWCQPY